jgi:hypothetical protein
MSVLVNINELAGELEILQDEIYLYLNRTTGESLMVPAHDISLAQSEPPESASFEWDWTEDELAILRDLPEHPDWLSLPEKPKIQEWSKKYGFGYRIPEARHLVQMLKTILDREGIRYK